MCVCVRVCISFLSLSLSLCICKYINIYIYIYSSIITVISHMNPHEPSLIPVTPALQPNSKTDAPHPDPEIEAQESGWLRVNPS